MYVCVCVCVCSIEKQKISVWLQIALSCHNMLLIFNIHFHGQITIGSLIWVTLERIIQTSKVVFSINRNFKGFGFHWSKDGNCQAYTETIYIYMSLHLVICQKNASIKWQSKQVLIKKAITFWLSLIPTTEQDKSHLYQDK